MARLNSVLRRFARDHADSVSLAEVGAIATGKWLAGTPVIGDRVRTRQR